MFLIALAGSLAGCGPVGQIVELMTNGGERVLREPMRPVTPGPLVLVLALDGIGDATLREALAAGAMPHLAALVGPSEGDVWQHAYAVPGAPSVFPSETAPGWAALFTGYPPSENGVAGNEWFDRDERAVYAPVPLSVGTIRQTLAIYTDDLLGGLIASPTVFEDADVRAHVSMGFVHRGADVLNPPDLGDIPDLLEAALRVLTGADPQAAGYRALDNDTWTGLRRSARRYGLPRLQVAYFPGVDLAMHAGRGPGPDGEFRHLTRVVDRRIGDILDFYHDAGVLDETYVLVVSDHGHTPVLDDDRHSLHSGTEGEPPDLFDSLGIRLRPFGIGSDSTVDAQAVLAYNEATAFVYLADRSSCPDAGDACDWTRGPRFESDVLPVARAFSEANASGAHAASLQGALDLILVRDARETVSASPPYRVFLAATDGSPERVISLSAYLAETGRTDLYRLDERLDWLTGGSLGDRAGDLLLLARAGAERPIEERFYFGAPRRSGHGSASRSDSEISFVLAHPRRLGSTLQARVYGVAGTAPTQLDVAPLILDLLGVSR